MRNIHLAICDDIQTKLIFWTKYKAEDRSIYEVPAAANRPNQFNWLNRTPDKIITVNPTEYGRQFVFSHQNERCYNDTINIV